MQSPIKEQLIKNRVRLNHLRRLQQLGDESRDVATEIRDLEEANRVLVDCIEEE